ncbi:MAG: hypothetical protein M3Y56_16905 [Armatimonadota bacterium]|nr:hypothetical protein [Armatimonadota bacterium]
MTQQKRRTISWAGILALALLLTVTGAAQAGFVRTGSMTTVRAGHTATLLPNGKVLIAGGRRDIVGVRVTSIHFNTAELYDPATGKFTRTGSMSNARSSHTATLLRNGNVLIAGGVGISGRVSLAELYNPITGAFTPTADMITARDSHTATLLNNGKVLITGGDNALGTLATAELYDPAGNGGVGSFTQTGSMSHSLNGHTATLLRNGKVLIVGGQTHRPPQTDSAELYDPATGKFTPTGSLITARWLHTATLLPNGKVLICGGINRGPIRMIARNSGTSTLPLLVAANDSDACNVSTSASASRKLFAAACSRENPDLASAELYTPATGRFTRTGSMRKNWILRTVTLLRNGRVLITEEHVNNDNLLIAEIYNPSTGRFSYVGTMSNSLPEGSTTLLRNGKVLFAGGDRTVFSWGGEMESSTLATAALYTYPSHPR